MLDLPDAIIVTLGIAGDKIKGRTTIQKLIYFESDLNLVAAEYRPHYYGPYSSEVAGMIQELIALGFIDEAIETRESTGFSVSDDWKRYHYELTDDGKEFLKTVESQFSEEYNKISKLVKICKDRSNLNPTILSCAAKVDYIAHQEKTIWDLEKIKLRAEALNWNLSPDQIEEATKLLADLYLYNDD